MLFGAASLRADVLLLKTGGRVEGEVLNPDQEPRTDYVLKLRNGGQLTLDAQQVAQVIASSPNEQLYLELLKRMPATAEGNWKMAEWCARKSLPAQRTFHLEEVVLLDPEHERARRALGHVRLDGQWGEPDELMRQRGFVKYKGRWRLPQDVELIINREEANRAEKEWVGKTKTWRSWIGKRRDAEARRNFEGLEDRRAAPAIVTLLERENNLDLQEMFIEILGRLHTSPALRALIDLSLQSNREETRQLCLDQLVEHGRETAMLAYIVQLKNSDHGTVRRAGLALQRVADRSAIEALIDALVTTHRFKVMDGGAGQLNATQGTSSDGTSGVSGFGVSGGPRTIERQFRNREVLDALIPLVDGANFQYDENSWKAWLHQRSTPAVVDLRRD
jgi:hypothetical protein